MYSIGVWKIINLLKSIELVHVKSLEGLDSVPCCFQCWFFQIWWFPEIGIVHYKPAILGYHHLWKPPYNHREADWFVPQRICGSNKGEPTRSNRFCRLALKTRFCLLKLLENPQTSQKKCQQNHQFNGEIWSTSGQNLAKIWSKMPQVFLAKKSRLSVRRKPAAFTRLWQIEAQDGEVCGARFHISETRWCFRNKRKWKMDCERWWQMMFLLESLI